MRYWFRTAVAVGFALGCAACAVPPTTSAASAKAEVIWLGQSAFKITLPGGKVIVTDPWLRTNPLTPAAYKQPMNPADAAWAVKELLRPKAVIPMHYGTNPLARGTAKDFIGAMGSSPVRVIVAVPGQPVPF